VTCTGEHELIEELFKQIKPGLSAYANDPRKVNCLPRLTFYCQLLVEILFFRFCTVLVLKLYLPLVN